MGSMGSSLERIDWRVVNAVARTISLADSRSGRSSRVFGVVLVMAWRAANDVLKTSVPFFFAEKRKDAALRRAMSVVGVRLGLCGVGAGTGLGLVYSIV